VQAPLDSLQTLLTALGINGVTSISPVAGGTDTAIWGVERAHERFALRLFRERQDAVCAREVAVMARAVAAGIPVPLVRAIGSWRERPALLLTWCDGWPLKDLLLSQPWRAWHLGRIFGETQAAIHAIQPPAELVEAGSWVDWEGPAEQQLALLLRRLEGSTPALLHLDYHPLNILSDGKRITGVLDWTNAHAGDARADVARTLTILRLIAPPPGLRGAPARGVLRAFEMGWRVGYAHRAGGMRSMMTSMAPFYAWAGAVMERDMAEKASSATIARVQRWTRRCQCRTLGL
jgi:aminoglycoside phosphotransferase (APT) family kinase protein